MDKLVKTLGITGLSKSQVSRMATDLDEHVDQFRNRPLHDAGSFTFVAADALTMKVREGLGSSGGWGGSLGSVRSGSSYSWYRSAVSSIRSVSMRPALN